MLNIELEIESKELLWFNHKLQGFYICSYEADGFKELFEKIDCFKENHYSILFSALMAEGDQNTAINVFAQSDSLSVWYELDKEIYFQERDCQERPPHIDELIVAKFKQLANDYKPGQCTQLLKYLFTAACLVIQDKASIELALSKLQDCTNDLKFMMYFIQNEEYLKKEWQERGHNSDEKHRYLHLAIMQQCKDVQFVTEVVKNKAIFSVLPPMMRPKYFLKARDNITALFEANPELESINLE